MLSKQAQDRIGTWVTAIAFLVVGVGVLGWAGRDAWAQRQSASWPSTPAHLLETKIEVVTRRNSTSDPRYYPRAKYEYVVDGKTYQGDTIHLFSDGDLDSSDSNSADAELQRFIDDPELKAYYDPLEPTRSCLVPGGGFSLTTVIMTVLIGFGGLAIGLFMLRAAINEQNGND